MKYAIAIVIFVATVSAAQACRWGQTCIPHGSGNGITYCYCNSGPGG